MQIDDVAAIGIRRIDFGKREFIVHATPVFVAQADA